jgi:hypothetical protein
VDIAKTLVVIAAVLVLGAGCRATKTVSESKPVPTTVLFSQTVAIAPSTALKSGQNIHIEARGFTPNQSGLGIVQCADSKGGSDAGNCNLGGIKVVTSDASGNVSADFTVVTGPFGGNGRRCSAQDLCVLSVSQLSLTPAEVASGPIAFN